MLILGWILMKRFLILILAFFYFTTANGGTVYLHYCMGELVKVDLWEQESKTCGSCGMDKTKSDAKHCCKDEQKQVKLDKTDAAAAQQVLQFKVFPAEVPVLQTLLSSDLTPKNHSEGHTFSQEPPRTPKNAVYIRNCTFLI